MTLLVLRGQRKCTNFSSLEPDSIKKSIPHPNSGSLHLRSSAALKPATIRVEIRSANCPVACMRNPAMKVCFIFQSYPRRVFEHERRGVAMQFPFVEVLKNS